MNGRIRPLRIWFAAIIVLAASVAGTGWVLRSRAGDSVTKASEGSTAAGSSAGVVVCFGHVDVDPGITPLYPLRPGRVSEVLVHEDDSVKAGTVLFRLDDRQARFQIRQAEEDLKASQLQLVDARKLPQQHALKLAQQQQAILA